MAGGRFWTMSGADTHSGDVPLLSNPSLLDKLTDVARHKLTLRGGVAALLCPHCDGTKLQADGRSGSISSGSTPSCFSLMKLSYSRSNSSRDVAPFLEMPFVRASEASDSERFHSLLYLRDQSRANCHYRRGRNRRCHRLVDFFENARTTSVLGNLRVGSEEGGHVYSA